LQDLRIHNVASFTLLDDKHFLVGFVPGPDGDSETQSQSGLYVYSMDSGGSLLATLLYPSIHAGVQVMTMTFAHQAAPGGPSVGQSAQPFCTSLDEKVVVIKLELENEDSGEKAVLTHCISLSSFWRYIKRITKHGPFPTELPWVAWAPRASQLFYCATNFPRIFLSAYGTRFLECSLVEIDGVPTGKLRLTLRDFSEKGFRKGFADATLQHGGEYGWTYHCDDQLDFGKGHNDPLNEFFDVQNIAFNGLATFLPYRSVSRLIDIPRNALPSWSSTAIAENSILLGFLGVRA
jgi:hypothetical protein